MRIRRIFLLLLLAMGLAALSTPARAVLLSRVSQIVNGYYQNGAWLRIMPDGSTQAFTLSQGQSFVVTWIAVRFYATEANTGPYRFLFKDPDGTIFFNGNMGDLLYPTTGGTVWGGWINRAYNPPGIIMCVIPTLEVRKLLQPPADANTGTVVTGTTYMKFTGYILP